MDDDVRTQPALWYEPGTYRLENPVPGLYSILENGQPEARLHGSWSDVPPLLATDLEQPLQILHGNVFGRAVTLVDCTVTGGKRNLSRLQDVTLWPSYAIEGLFLEASELAFTEVYVHYWDQDIWTEWNAYEAEVTANSSRYDIRIASRSPKEVSAQVQDASITLCDASTFSQTPQPSDGWILKSQSKFHLTFREPLPIDDLFSRFLVPLEALIISATGRPSGIKSLQATNREWPQIPNSRYPSDRWVKVRVSYHPRPSKELYYVDLLHLLRDFDFARQLPLVMEAVEQHRYSIEHFAAIKRPNSGGALANFVAASQLVESFDRTLHDDQPSPGQVDEVRKVEKLLSTTDIDAGYRSKIKNFLKRSHEPSLEERLRRLDAETGLVVTDIVSNRRWCADIARLRNIVVHGLPASEALTRDIRSIQVATDILLKLFESRWLCVIGFEKSQAQALIARRRDYNNATRRIRENYEHVRSLVERYG